MSYLPPFSVLKQSFEFKSTKSGLMATASYEDLVEMIKTLLRCIDFDEEWYLKTYPDIAEAVKEGRIESGRWHFLENGYFEGRLPAPVKIDEKWYLKNNPDVAVAVKEGIVASAEAHFRETGYFEGRLPRPF
jgi:hypothetical protein